MIWFDRIELATHPNKPLDPMDFKAKEVLNSSFGSAELITMKWLKSLQIEILLAEFFPRFRFNSLRFNLVRIKFGGFTVCTSR